MTVGSLFAGIGGFDLGFERAGFEIRWQVEIDPFCLAVLEKHWPDVRRYEDVRTVGAELGYVDVICGGFPCQDLSSAGKRAGVDGDRSGLWREFIRIVGTCWPRCVVVENVHHAWREWVPVLRRALWDLGYPSLPIQVQASDFGAEHERKRVILVAHINPSVLRLESWRRGWPFWEVAPILADALAVGHDESRAPYRRWQAEAVPGDDGGSRETPDAVGVRCDTPEWQESESPRGRQALTDVDSGRQLQPQGFEPDERGWARHGYRWPAEPDVVRVVHGVPSRAYGRWLSGRVAAIGNSVVPVEIEWIARQIIAAEETLRRGDGRCDSGTCWTTR